MGLRIEALDPTDFAEFREFYSVYARANQDSVNPDGSKESPLYMPWLAEELEIAFLSDEYTRFDPIFVRREQNIVAVAFAELPQRDNFDTAYLEVWVPPELRRQGLGSALLARLEMRCGEDSRTRFMSETVRPLNEDSSAGVQFLYEQGFGFDTSLAQNQLTLPCQVEEPGLAHGFRLESWRGLPPNRWIDRYAQLRAALNSEAPSGEVQLNDEYWDASRLKHEHDQWKRQKRIAQTVVAIDAEENLVGHTQLVFSSLSPIVYQWDTLVVPAARGNGLGLALKREAMRAAADLCEDKRFIVTWNDSKNTHMLDINKRLGYRQTAWVDQFFKVLG
jgi:GNAT superfamily N-acetyltransferase